jgi:hypothetical protein
MALFDRNPPPIDPDNPASHLEAYKEGRRDERRQMEAGVLDRRLVKRELDEAYERGRVIGLARRPGSFLGALWFLVLLAVLISTGVMVATYGSFQAAGLAIDRMIASI